ncbi:hypothetical protein D3OALGB2SA_2241 [Olavius algarvensis associated proteobacterium Delta 3]|nr:hypothetical protein D3OALGB2SA_2241 [Olavius algarvensis associated proteobacterium Delta 3]
MDSSGSAQRVKSFLLFCKKSKVTVFTLPILLYFRFKYPKFHKFTHSVEKIS